MSFIVQIWEQPDGFPKPASVKEACDLVDLAAERADAARPNERLRAFVGQIRERWPITVERGSPRDDPGKARLDLGVWKDDSLRQDPGSDPVLVLGIDTDRVDAVVPWLAEAGPLAGVNVADPQSGSAWLADGSVFALTDAGACAKALARWNAGDDRAAWERFVELAQHGRLLAFEKLAEMYAEARFVGRNPAISLALRAMANGWRLVDGIAVAPESGTSAASSSLGAARAKAGAAVGAKADALFARLRADANLRETLLSAAHEFDARHAGALDLIAGGAAAAAALRLQPLADRGHEPSQRTLANLWATGQAEPADPKQELDWIKAAADRGDAPALQRLAWLYDEGVLLKRNARNARGIHRLLIGRGETSAIRNASRIELKRLVGPAGSRFWQGRSESELQPLAEQGDVAAMVELASLIEWGRSIDQVWERSTPWWVRAAEAGDRLAQYHVATFHVQGRGVPRDETRATHWYGLSARQGHGAAQVEYARRLGLALGIARDDAQSRHWLEQAARQRVAAALRHLSQGHAGGLYPKDLLVAQVLAVLHDRIQDAGLDDFHGPDEVDPREVRRLLAEIDGGADLLQLLKRRASQQVGVPPGGLSLAPIAPPPAPPAPAMPSAAPRRASAASQPATRATAAPRRGERAVPSEIEPERPVERVERSNVGPLLICASFAVLAIAVAMLRRNANANVVAPWLVGSALAAAGAFRLARERGKPASAAALDAVPMFVPFLGSGLALRLLYLRRQRA